jgi:putative transposase
MRYRRDHLAGASYFFTATLQQRSSALLLPAIAVLRDALRQVKRSHPFSLDAIVVLPDHLHTIWTLPADDADYPLRWRLIKAHFSRAMARTEPISASRQRQQERGIWQRRYWEHRLRDSDDWWRHVDYIHYNPVKHGYVCQVGDWPYSSFHDFVRRGILPADWAG